MVKLHLLCHTPDLSERPNVDVYVDVHMVVDLDSFLKKVRRP